MTAQTYYAAQWPILDEGLTRSQLVTIATPDLYRLMAEAGAVMTGDPEWSTAEQSGQAFLHVRVPARRADS